MHTRDFRGFYGKSLRTPKRTYSEKFSFLHFLSRFNLNAPGLKEEPGVAPFGGSIDLNQVKANTMALSLTTL